MTLPWGQGTGQGKALKGQEDPVKAWQDIQQLGSRYWLQQQLP